MIQYMIRQNWLKYANIVIPFLGPIAFEFSNSVTGEWLNAQKKLNLSTGKIITLLIGVAYIVVMICLLWYDEKKKRYADNLQMQLDELQKRTKVYEHSNETLRILLAYLEDKIKAQIDYLREHGKIDVRDLNINSASANIARIIYKIISDNSTDIKLSVNIYDRTIESGPEYTTMIAHEGHVSQPSAFGVPKVLSPDKSNNRYCEKVILSNKPDYRILLTKEEVAKAFNQSLNKCKYNQYLGIPIRKLGGINIALIEIVAHDKAVIWKTEDEAIQFAADYCETLKEYILLIKRIYEQGEAIARKIGQRGGVQHGKSNVDISTS